MLLTEHQELYERRNEPAVTGQVTSEELTMIRDYVLLPHMLTMVERSATEMRRSKDILKQLYERAAQVLLNRISGDMHKLRSDLSWRRIKLIDEEQDDLIMYHRFICRGYEGKLSIVREVMRAEIGLRLARYYRELSRQMDDQDKDKKGRG